MSSEQTRKPGDLARHDEKLIRALGVPTLTASIVNATVGAGIFVLPAVVAAGLGAAAPIAYVICAVVMALVVTSFAIAGSRVSLTGGLYAYVEVAFGSYIGFLAGVLLWLTNVLAVAGVASAIAASVAVIFPLAQGGLGRLLILVLIFSGLAVINIRGVRGGAGTVAGMTIAKLLPLLLFIAVGVFFITPAALGWSVWPESDAIGKTVLLLIFAFMGIELALVPSGEVKNPSRTVPRSIFFALAITSALYIAIQLVAQGVLGAELSKFVDAPLAEAAARFLGNAGRSILLVGAVISAFGYVSGDVLGSPRTLYAFGRNGILPAKMAAVHPRFRTPHIAIIVHAIIACILSVSSTFQYLAILSNIAALLLYLFCCSAAFELIRRNVVSDGKPFAFPGDKVVPFLALGIVLWILSHATLAEFSVAIGVLTVASLLFCFRRSNFGKRSDVAWAATGALAGGFIAFLLRPSVLGQQLPFVDVITRGTTLDGAQPFAIPLAETSFNFLLAGTILGTLVGWVADRLASRTRSESVDK